MSKKVQLEGNFGGSREDVYPATMAEIVYTQDGKNLEEKMNETNAQLSDISRKIALTINVREVGALGDGENDDCIAIRKAIEMLKIHGGGVVYFPSGVYALNSLEHIRECIHIYPNMSLTFRGDGESSVIKLGDNVYKDDTPVCVIGNQNTNELINYLKFENLSFDGNAGNNPVLTGWTKTPMNPMIYVKYIDKLIVDQCYFKNCNGRNVILVNNFIVTPTNFQSNHVVIKNCVFENLGAGCVASEAQNDHSTLYINSKYCYIENNIFRNENPNLDYTKVHSNAIELHCVDGIVENNFIENMKLPFIISSYEIALNRIIIKDNTVRNCEYVCYHFPTNPIHSIEFINNDITLKATKHNNSLFSFHTKAGDSVVNSLIIKDNRVICEYASSLQDTSTSYIHSFGQFKNILKLTIDNNEFKNCGSRGLYIVPIQEMDITITNNKLSNVWLSEYPLDLYKNFIYIGKEDNVTVNTIIIDKNVMKNENDDLKIAVRIDHLLFNKLSINGNKIIGFVGDLDVKPDSSLRDIDIYHVCKGNPRETSSVACNNGSVFINYETNEYFVKSSGGTTSSGGWLLNSRSHTIPTSGEFLAGDKIINNRPSLHGVIGNQYYIESWLCVESGNVGVWVANKISV